MRVIVAALILTALLGPAVATADVQSQYDQATSNAQSLRNQIHSDDAGIQRYQPRIDDLQTRLSGLQTSLGIQQRELSDVQGRLRVARASLLHLRIELAQDKKALASQLVAQYKDPSPNLVTVVLDSRGFKDLIETTRALSNVARHNTEVTNRVGIAKKQVAGEAKRLADLEKQQAIQTAAVLSERDQVAAIRQDLLTRQSKFVTSKAGAKAKLAKIEEQRKKLGDQLAQLQAQAAGYSGPVPSLTGGYAAHGGSYGFFPAPGTNYSVGDEPELARHLDVLGKALHLHLIGLSGFRTPQHSVEVGGFPNDPHTRGEASDTPGVEGVAESTLNKFGLTRPFGGAAEADHIQLT